MVGHLHAQIKSELSMLSLGEAFNKCRRWPKMSLLGGTLSKKITLHTTNSRIIEFIAKLLEEFLIDGGRELLLREGLMPFKWMLAPWNTIPGKVFHTASSGSPEGTQSCHPNFCFLKLLSKC
jgi:hypothetical protein